MHLITNNNNITSIKSNNKQGSRYIAHPKFQNISRTFQDPQDIFPDCFCNLTTYKFTEKQQPAAVNNRAI